MIFLKNILTNQAMKSFHKKFQSGVKMQSKPASHLLKIQSPIPSPKMIFYAQKSNCHHIPAQNVKILSSLKVYPLPTTLFTDKMPSSYYLTLKLAENIVGYSEVRWNLPSRVGSRGEGKYKNTATNKNSLQQLKDKTEECLWLQS